MDTVAIDRLVAELLAVTERQAEDRLRALRLTLSHQEMREVQRRWQEAYWRDFYARMPMDDWL
jgi:hypothetical protein